jgi:exo-beta-1,3-glucanase (GH17 family)
MSYNDERNLPIEEYKKLIALQKNAHEVTSSEISTQDLAQLWRETLQKGIHGLSFSAYEEGQKPGSIITEQQVRRRMEIIAPYTKWVRSFSCTEGNEFIPKIAREFGIKTLVGAWLGDNLEDNEREIEGLVKLANAGYVDIAAVGNEVLFRKELSENIVLDYIKRVKDILPRNIPVSYVDAYNEYLFRPKIIEACDVLLINSYPYWDGCPIEYSFHHLQNIYNSITGLDKNKRIIISETGWPSQGSAHGSAQASEQNAMKYFIDTMKWSKENEVEIFYFSSFDEPWKVDTEGDVGAYWGIWDKNEKLKNSNIL